MTTSQLNIIYSSQTEIGRRSTNDDCILVEPNSGLYVICDGAKGRFGGRTAGELACQQIHAYLETINQGIGPTIDPHAEQVVSQVLTAAHDQIIAAQAADHTLKGMTSTVAMVLHRGEQVLIAHVGDSRVFLCRDRQLYQMTRDHNLKNYLQDNPGVRPKTQVSGKTLVRALGLQTSRFGIDFKHLQLQDNDLILICCDGLTDSVPVYTLREILCSTEISSLEEVTPSLIRSALTHGSMDNISCVLLHVTDRAANEPRTTIIDLAASSGVVIGWLIFLDGSMSGQVVPLEGSTVIGYEASCKIILQEDFISKRHAEVLRTEHGFIVKDLGSTNGTFINNIRTKEESLVDGDVLRVGATEMIFKCHTITIPQ